MRYLFLFLMMTAYSISYSQSLDIAAEETAVEAAILDYIEGWYEGDSIRIERSMHNDMIKRIPMKESTDSDVVLRMVPKSAMVEMTTKGGGENPNAEYQIFVDDIEQDIAAARVLSPEYLDYLHLVKTNEGWQIVNILFRKH